MNRQHKLILDHLIKAGTKGINSYGVDRKLALQLPARIWELSHKYNCVIIKRRNPDRSINYVLAHVPSTLRKKQDIPKPKGQWDFSTGKAVWVEEGQGKFDNL
jgi:hypothetical protein